MPFSSESPSRGQSRQCVNSHVRACPSTSKTTTCSPAHYSRAPSTLGASSTLAGEITLFFCYPGRGQASNAA